MEQKVMSALFIFVMYRCFWCGAKEKLVHKSIHFVNKHEKRKRERESRKTFLCLQLVSPKVVPKRVYHYSLVVDGSFLSLQFSLFGSRYAFPNFSKVYIIYMVCDRFACDTSYI